MQCEPKRRCGVPTKTKVRRSRPPKSKVRRPAERAFGGPYANERYQTVKKKMALRGEGVTGNSVICDSPTWKRLLEGKSGNRESLGLGEGSGSGEGGVPRSSLEP